MKLLFVLFRAAKKLFRGCEVSEKIRLGADAVITGAMIFFGLAAVLVGAIMHSSEDDYALSIAVGGAFLFVFSILKIGFQERAGEIAKGFKLRLKRSR